MKIERIIKKIYIIPVILAMLALAVNAQKPIDLIQGVKELSPADYYQLSQQAEQFYIQQNYTKAAEAYAQLTEAYPWDGPKLRRLALSLYRAGKYHEAIESFLKANKFGMSIQPQYNAVYLAESYARTGDKENAFVWLEKALTEFRFNQKPSLLKNSGFDSLKDDPRFRKLMGLLPNRKFSRDEGWRYDVDYLLSEIKRVNPVYSKQPLPSELIQAAAQLKKQIPKLSNEQIMYEMQHLLVLLRQAHNNLFLPGKTVNPTQLPLTFYAFPEGLFVVDASSPYENLIGSRVLRFDDSTAEKALEVVEYIIGRENDMAVLSTGADRLKVLQALYTLKLTAKPDRVTLTLIDRAGKTITISPEPVPYSSRQKLNAPRIAGIAAPPLYLSKPDDEYWFEYLRDDKTIYLQYNQVEDKTDESLYKFGLRLRDFLAKNEVRNLIVDVRRNNGGSTFVDAELLRTLVDFDSVKGNKLFIFAGRYTFSAASNFITDVDRLTNAVFVGEPSGGKPLMVGGDESPITLPFSGVGGALSSTTWALTEPRDNRLWIAPDIPVPVTAKDFFSNRDPLLETVLTMINKSNQF